MKLNREQIVKALECCASSSLEDCDNCPIDKQKKDNCECGRYLAIQALALFREQAEEIDRLRGVGLPDYSTYIRLSDAKTAIMAYICEQTVSKYASQVECKAARSGAEGAMNELDYITPAQVAPVADTVREFAERLKGDMNNVARWTMHGDENEYFIIGKPFIDQTAKELLEEE